MKRFSIILVSVLAACGVGGEAPSGGDGTVGGNGDGTGGGNGDGSGTGGGTGGTMSATRFLEEISKKFCDQGFTCKASFPTDQGGTFEEAFGASASACYADAAAANMPAQVEAQITAGKIEYKASDASACISGIAFGTCQEFWTTGPNMPAACDTVFVGKVADGQTCVTHIECTNIESYCDDTTNKCTPDQSGARTVPSPEEPWHTQSTQLLKK